MNPKVDAFISKAKSRQEELKKLRMIALDCGLTEELKWGKPCYTFEGSNVVIIQGFKEYCALLFFKGVLLKDPDGILEKTGPNTRVGRQIRFNTVKEIVKLERSVKACIYQAIEAEKAGLKVAIKKKTSLKLLDLLQKKMEKSPSFKTAFNSLTPGRQRAYNIYFSGAKQPATREARIEKWENKILQGKGLNDR